MAGGSRPLLQGGGWPTSRGRLMQRPELNVRLHGGLTPQQCIEFALSAEAASFAGLWFAENPFNRGILPAAAACAVAAPALQIGAGVFNPFNRHPTLIAMEVGALDELAQGRVRLGIGSGIGSAVERMGFSYSRPLSALREAIVIVRALLRGDEVTHAGHVFSVKQVKLDYRPRSDIPIYMAARGEQSLRACGELADGLLVSNMCAPAFTARAVTRVREAAQAARRKAPGVVQYMPCSADPDRAKAHRAAKIATAEMLPGYRSLGTRLAGARAALQAGSGLYAAAL